MCLQWKQTRRLWPSYNRACGSGFVGRSTTLREYILHGATRVRKHGPLRESHPEFRSRQARECTLRDLCMATELELDFAPEKIVAVPAD